MPAINYSTNVELIKAGNAYGYDPSSAKLNSLGDNERTKRYNLITKYWNYYEGDHPKPIKPNVNEEYDDNVIFNLCGQAIDKTVAFLFPMAPRLEFKDETMQTTADKIWQDNEIEIFVVNLALTGTVAGHPYARLYIDENGDPAVTLLDARTVTVFWDQRDPRKVLWYRITWETRDSVGVLSKNWQDIVPDRILNPGSKAKTWHIIEYWQKPGQSATKVDSEEWPFEFCPIVDWKNDPAPFKYYGPSDLRHFHVNDVLNFVASNTGRILRFHAHPKTIVLGVTANQLEQTAINQAWAIPTSDAKVFNLEMQTDLGSSMEMLDRARGAFFAQMRVVDMATHKDKIGQITNFGLHVLFSDMLDMIKIKRQLYGKGLAIITQRLLQMAGIINAVRPGLVWEEALPVNRTEMVNAATIEQRLGFTSDRTLAADLGRDYDTENAILVDEKERKADEAEEKMRRQMEIGNQFAVNKPFNQRDE